MIQPTSNSPGLQSFSELAPLPAEEALSWLRSLLAQVSALHRAGRLHGAIVAGGVVIDEHRQPTLSPPAERAVLDGETCPPELPAGRSWNLPTDLNHARAALAADGFDMDPRRIDIYQLGMLLGRLVTGQSTSDYLRSPNSRSLVPPALRPVIDRALGHDANTRTVDCEQFSTLLVEAAGAAAASWERETPALGNARTPVTLPGPPAEQTDGPFHLSGASDAPLSRLGGFKILQRIGGGGMGDVYKAHDESLDRIVAVKVLPPELARHADFVRRFRAEAMAIAKLTHPNIVQVFAFGEDGGRHFFAMQFVDGESLADLLQRRGRLPLNEALPIFEQCLAGLAAAHQRNLIHRDIKPGNILLDRQHHRALVADFGLVKNFDSESRLTASGVIMGTVDYISPEQARGQPVDGRSDLYSLGALMYQSLSGCLPFVSESATGLMFQHAYEQPRPLAEIVPDLPKQVQAIVVRLMAKDPAQRYAKAEDVLADIAAFRAGKPPASTAGGESKSKIIVTPHDVARDLPTPDGLFTSAGGRAIGQWRDRLWNMLHAFAPRAAQRLANTQHQVDGAVVEYERRHNELANLVREAEGVAVEFAAQAASHREAAAAAECRGQRTGEAEAAAAARQDQAHCQRVAADFESQLAEQQDQLETLRLRSRQVDATLQQLRSQRDVLQARLRAAQTRLATEGGVVARRSRSIWIAPAAIAAVLALIGASAALQRLRRPTPPSTVVGNPLFRDAVLVATFDESSLIRDQGDTRLRDLTGTRPPATIHGATLVPGKAGLGLALKTDGDHADFGKAVALPRPALAVCAWIKPTAPPGEFADIVSEDSAVGGVRGYFLMLYTGRPYLAVGDGSCHWFGAERQVPLDRWTHIAAVRGANQARFYVNGALAGTSDDSKLIQPAATALHIGNSAEADGRQFYGVIDEVAVFERALSDEEIQRIYRLGAAGLSLDAAESANPPAVQPEQAPPESNSPGGDSVGPVTAEKIVLWNLHDGVWADRGTNVCNVELRRGGKAVWSQKDVKVAWSNTVDPATEIPLPNIPFDTVRLDIVNWVQWGAGLSEVEVIKDGRNIALGKPVKVNGERLPFIGARVVDGIKAPGAASIGIWWAPDNQPAWIEIILAKPSPPAAEAAANVRPEATKKQGAGKTQKTLPARSGEFRVPAPISKVSISDDGSIVLVNHEGESQLYEIATGRALGEARQNSVATGFLPDGQTPFAAPWEGAFRLLDPQTGDQSGEGISGWQVKSVAFSPDGRQSAVGELRGALTISDLASRQQRRHLVFDRNHPILATAFSPDGKRVLTVTSDGSAKWFDAVTGGEAATVEGPLSTSLAMLPDGRIVSASLNGQSPVEVRDPASGKIVARWQGHAARINDIAVSPAGDCISVAQDNSARLWNTATGTSTVLWQHEAELVSVGFSADGRNLVIAGRSGLIRYWLGWSGQSPSPLGGEAPAVNKGSSLSGSKGVAAALYLQDMPLLSAIRDESFDAPVSLAGEHSPHGFMLRPVGALGHMVFDIAGRQAVRFRGRVGLNDSMTAKTDTLPQTFRIVLDDKPVWKSRALRERGASQEFDIPVAGVKKIELVDESPDIDKEAHPVWFEPRLSTAVFDAIAHLAAAKDFDATAPDEVAYAEATQGVSSAAQHREVAIALRTLCDQALAAEQYPEAKHLIRMAGIAAGKSNEPTLVKETDTRQAEVAATAAEYDKVQKSRDSLTGDPQDPVANLQLGSFECFYQGNWAVGLPRIARGGAGNLPALARREVQSGDLPSKLAAVADEWWTLADAETGLPGKQLLFHAADLYRRAAGHLGDGPVKANAEQRVREVGQMPDAPFEFRTYSWCRIVNRATGSYLAVSAGRRNAGEGIIQWAGRSGADQQWQFVFNADGDARIENRNSGLPFGIREGSKRPGMDALQWPSNGYAWRLERVTGKYVRFVAEQSGLCLDVNIDRAVQSVPGTTETQFWSLEPNPQNAD